MHCSLTFRIFIDKGHEQLTGLVIAYGVLYLQMKGSNTLLTEQIRRSFRDFGLVGILKGYEPKVSFKKGLHASFCHVSLWVSGT